MTTIVKLAAVVLATILLFTFAQEAQGKFGCWGCGAGGQMSGVVIAVRGTGYSGGATLLVSFFLFAYIAAMFINS